MQRNVAADSDMGDAWGSRYLQTIDILTMCAYHVGIKLQQVCMIVIIWDYHNKPYTGTVESFSYHLCLEWTFQ